MSIKVLARNWRLRNDESVGVVLIWEDEVCGWKDCLRDARHERPGTLAVDTDDHIFIATGGNDYDGAHMWVLLNEQ